MSSSLNTSFEVYNGSADNDDFNYNGSKILFADGQEGDDFIWGNTENDQIRGGKGNDQLRGWRGTDLVFGQTGNDLIFGEQGNDDLYGGRNNDQLVGGNGTDLLNGYGGSYNERDTLTGGTGGDVFVLGDYQFNSLSGKAYYTDAGVSEPLGRLVPNSYAVITDFSSTEADKIQVYGNISDYRLETGSLGVGLTELDTAIYRGDDLIAVVQDTTNVALSRDFVSARPSIIN